jgi:hypothetical protein
LAPPSEAAFAFPPNSGRILGRECWAWVAYLSHNLPCSWSVRCIQNLSNKQRLESFPNNSRKWTRLQILHQIIAIRSYKDDGRQALIQIQGHMLTGSFGALKPDIQVGCKSQLYHLTIINK